MTCHELERGLDAYVDGELGSAEAAAFEDHLTSCVGCRQRLADRESLGRLVRRAPFRAAPDRLRRSVAVAHQRSQFRRGLAAWAAAVTIAASLGGALAVRILRLSPTVDAASSITDDLVGGHVRALMADHLFDIHSSDQHTVKPWFTGRLDFSPPVEDLATLGFPLVGGRLDYVAGRSAAGLVYQRRQHTINLFIWPESSASVAAVARSVRGFQLRHWNQGGMSFWAVSDLNDAELTVFEHALQH